MEHWCAFASHYCRGKAISITYAEYMFVALAVQHAQRVRRIILSSLACLTVPYFSTLSHKRHDFRKMLLNIKCLFWFSLQRLSERFLILRRIRRDIIINSYRSSCYVATRYSNHILRKLALSGQFLKNIQFHENQSSGSRVDSWGRTDRQDEANSRFSQFCKCA